MITKLLNFWFTEIDEKQWWQKNAEFDVLIKTRFGKLHQQAVLGELYTWRETAQGCLAEIIILDQFSRNIYRDTPMAFAADPMALTLAQHAVHCGIDKALPLKQRSFIYMPYMHSESAKIHEIAIKLFSISELKNNYEFELQHKKIIDRFGRYPHRNAILGRTSTVEELEFLQQPNSSF